MGIQDTLHGKRDKAMLCVAEPKAHLMLVHVWDRGHLRMARPLQTTPLQANQGRKELMGRGQPKA
jgi:hypothetical protein